MIAVNRTEQNDVLFLVLHLFVHIKPARIGQCRFARSRNPLNTVQARDIQQHIEMRNLTGTVQMVDRARHVLGLDNNILEHELFKLLRRDQRTEVTLQREPRQSGRKAHPAGIRQTRRAAKLYLSVKCVEPEVSDMHGKRTDFLGIVIEIVKQIFRAAQGCDNVHNTAKVGQRNGEIAVLECALLNPYQMLPELGLFVEFDLRHIVPVTDHRCLIKPDRIGCQLEGTADTCREHTRTEIGKHRRNAFRKVCAVQSRTARVVYNEFLVQPFLLDTLRVSVPAVIGASGNVQKRTTDGTVFPECFIAVKHRRKFFKIHEFHPKHRRD